MGGTFGQALVPAVEAAALDLGGAAKRERESLIDNLLVRIHFII